MGLNAFRNVFRSWSYLDENRLCLGPVGRVGKRIEGKSRSPTWRSALAVVTPEKLTKQLVNSWLTKQFSARGFCTIRPLEKTQYKIGGFKNRRI